MKFLKEKGITLIALVVTIVILLILAGVSIAMLTGDNGILSQAQNAKNKTEEAERNEKLDLLKQEDLINETLNGAEVVKVTDEKPGELEKEDENTLVINSIEDLVFFAYDVTNGNNYSGKTVKLGTSLDFNSTKSYVDPLRTDYGKYGYNGELKKLLTTEEGFIPIGAGSDEVGTNSFSGTFDGKNNKIINLYINEKDETASKIGLFSVNYGSIENLNLVNLSLTRYEEQGSLTGGLVGQNRTYAVINNCNVSGKININGVGTVAGITGHNMGLIENCSNLADIKIESKGKDLGDCYIGGIAGSVEGSIKKCLNKGNLDMILEGNLTKRTLIYAGGVGGLSGNLTEECYNLGNINVEFNGNGEQILEVQVGGVSGNLEAGEIISNCYNIGNVTANSNKEELFVGGIASKGIGGEESPEIKNCYNIGSVYGNCDERKYIGGIASLLTAEITNCYYLNQENFTNNGAEAGTVITEEEMKQDSFVELLNNENEEEIWKKDTGINNGYPILMWQIK